MTLVRIEWDGTFLIGWATVEEKLVQVRVSREMIRAMPMYNDILDWEIERYKEEIFERLRPTFPSVVVA